MHISPARPPRSLQAGKAARRRRAQDVEHLVGSASYVVEFVARQYRGRGVAFDDLLAAGNVGLVIAAHRFDDSRGFRFSTYAAWWVRKEIQEAVETSALVRVPGYTIKLRRRLAESAKPARDASQARRIASSFIRVESLSAVHPEQDQHSLLERLADPDAVLPSAAVVRSAAIAAMIRALEILGERERTILDLRFGLNARDPMILDDVAERVGVSRERVRQIEKAALERLRREIDAPRRTVSRATRGN